MVAPEALLLEFAEGDSAIGALIDSTGPLVTPYDELVRINGWFIDPSRTVPTAPFDDPTQSVDQRAINALLVACDYAVRRGACTAGGVRLILERESPIAVRTAGLECSVGAIAGELGVAAAGSQEQTVAFARRARAHAESSIVCDPVLSFQPRTLDWDMGDNSLSSFVVHNSGQGDGVLISGEVTERWGIEIGLPLSTPVEGLPDIEREVALMPCFLPGVSSEVEGERLEVGWAVGQAPEIGHIGECIRVWSKALFDLEFADVRIIFAPSHGRSSALTEMRARARAFRRYRDALIAGLAGSITDPFAERFAGE